MATADIIGRDKRKGLGQLNLMQLPDEFASGPHMIDLVSAAAMVNQQPFGAIPSLSEGLVKHAPRRHETG